MTTYIIANEDTLGYLCETSGLFCPLASTMEGSDPKNGPTYLPPNHREAALPDFERFRLMVPPGYVIRVRPTQSGNGFTAGKAYTAEHVRMGMYRTQSDAGHERYIQIDEPSPHLWDGVNWDAAGRFELCD